MPVIQLLIYVPEDPVLPFICVIVGTAKTPLKY